MGVRIAGGGYIPAAEEKIVAVLSGDDGVEHYRKVSAGGVLHACRHMDTAADKTVLLIFNRAGTDSHVGNDIGQLPVIFGVKHFIGNRHFKSFKSVHVHFTDCDETI